MPRLRPMALVALAIALYGVGCDSQAVAVSDCRDIERTRCATAGPCGFGIDASNEATCERYARDNCLHGMPTAEGPTAGELQRCLNSLRAAGACAANKNQGPETLALDCAPIGSITLATASVCDIIEAPEGAIACSFLLAEPKPAVVVDAGTHAEAGAQD